MRLQLEQRTRITAGLASHRHPAVSPDGAWVAHTVTADGVSAIVLTDRSGRYGQRLGPASAARRDPFFLEKTLLGFCEEASGGFRVVTRDVVSGKQKTLLAHPSASLLGPTVSKRRGRLAVSGDVTRDQGCEAILEVALGGNEIEKLTEQAGQTERAPSYSPDGNQVAFEGYARADADVCALCVFDVKRRRTQVVAFEPDTRYRCPRYLDQGRVLFARETAKGRRELVVCEVRSKRMTPLALDLPATDPALFPWPGGGQGLAFAGQEGVRGADEDAGRPYDIFVAKLTGL